MLIGPAPSRPLSSPTPHAILPDGSEAAPTDYGGGFHGTSEVPPEVALKDGLPAHGDDWNLLEHVYQDGNSAFRGATRYITDPVRDTGAAYWAGQGGWVYDVEHVPTWDVNALLEDRIPNPDGFGYRSNPVYGENEMAIPGHILPQNIRRWGQVASDATGHLYVPDWHDNPGFHG
ncbi:MAG: hypothetical protein ACYCW6_18440 [Candidatus Xenobia bacterium]